MYKERIKSDARDFDQVSSSPGNPQKADQQSEQARVKSRLTRRQEQIKAVIEVQRAVEN